MILHKPTIEFHGPVADHDQCCPIIHDEPAVLDMDTGVFQPSWKAQRMGWALIQTAATYAGIHYVKGRQMYGF